MIRLAKYIASAGYCSRKAASRLIESGVVTVNNIAATHIMHVCDEDTICINHERLPGAAKKCYLIYNKPVGVDCVCEPHNKDSIIHQIDHTPRIFPVGRLDKDSHGLILLTNDGELCQRILHPDYYHEKDYIVRVNHPVNQQFLSQMTAGVSYKNIITRPCTIQPVSEDTFKITLTQGLNRQIRHMCKALGYNVISLKRVRLVNLCLGELPINQYRPLTPDETNSLFQHCLAG